MDIYLKYWEDVKLEVMYYATRWKYSMSNPTLRGLLIGTGDMLIEEGNNWGDYFWGVDIYTGYGDNNLGKIIVSVRDKIKLEGSIGY